jgi:hypothetical protein
VIPSINSYRFRDIIRNRLLTAKAQNGGKV